MRRGRGARERSGRRGAAEGEVFTLFQAAAGRATLDGSFLSGFQGSNGRLMRHCAYCKKQPSVGNNVSHANNKTKRRWNPNLQEVRAEINGNVRRIRVGTGCIRPGKFKKSA